MGNKAGTRHLWIAVVVLLFASGIAGGYFYFSRKFPSQPPAAEQAKTKDAVITDDLFTLRVYYPVNGRLQMENRKVQRKTGQIAVAEAVIIEFLKGRDAKDLSVPGEVRILGIYAGGDKILYVDMSDEFRRNFTGDAAAEFLLLQAFFESLISNVQDIIDVKILIEGKEMETLGGHIHIIYPLKEIVSQMAEGGQQTANR